MRKNERQIDESELLPFHIIQAASEGDVEAINVVLKHYEGYITSLSTRMLFDEYGQAHEEHGTHVEVPALSIRIFARIA